MELARATGGEQGTASVADGITHAGQEASTSDVFAESQRQALAEQHPSYTLNVAIDHTIEFYVDGPRLVGDITIDGTPYAVKSGDKVRCGGPGKVSLGLPVWVHFRHRDQNGTILATNVAGERTAAQQDALAEAAYQKKQQAAEAEQRAVARTLQRDAFAPTTRAPLPSQVTASQAAIKEAMADVAAARAYVRVFGCLDPSEAALQAIAAAADAGVSLAAGDSAGYIVYRDIVWDFRDPNEARISLPVTSGRTEVFSARVGKLPEAARVEATADFLVAAALPQPQSDVLQTFATVNRQNSGLPADAPRTPYVVFVGEPRVGEETDDQLIPAWVEFIPIVGDLATILNTVAAISSKGFTIWSLVAIAGAVVGFIPGVGDAAGLAMRRLANAGRTAVRGGKQATRAAVRAETQVAEHALPIDVAAHVDDAAPGRVASGQDPHTAMQEELARRAQDPNLDAAARADVSKQLYDQRGTNAIKPTYDTEPLTPAILQRQGELDALFREKVAGLPDAEEISALFAELPTDVQLRFLAKFEDAIAGRGFVKMPPTKMAAAIRTLHGNYLSLSAPIEIGKPWMRQAGTRDAADEIMKSFVRGNSGKISRIAMRTSSGALEVQAHEFAIQKMLAWQARASYDAAIEVGGSFVARQRDGAIELVDFVPRTQTTYSTANVPDVGAYQFGDATQVTGQLQPELGLASYTPSATLAEGEFLVPFHSHHIASPYQKVGSPEDYGRGDALQSIFTPGSKPGDGRLILYTDAATVDTPVADLISR